MEVNQKVADFTLQTDEDKTQACPTMPASPSCSSFIPERILLAAPLRPAAFAIRSKSSRRPAQWCLASPGTRPGPGKIPR